MSFTRQLKMAEQNTSFLFSPRNAVFFVVIEIYFGFFMGVKFYVSTN
jgi:hypothetical protein